MDEVQRRMHEIESHYVLKSGEPASGRNVTEDVRYVLSQFRRLEVRAQHLENRANKHTNAALEMQSHIIELHGYLKAILAWAEGQPRETLFAIRQLLNEYLEDESSERS